MSTQLICADNEWIAESGQNNYHVDFRWILTGLGSVVSINTVAVLVWLNVDWIGEFA